MALTQTQRSALFNTLVDLMGQQDAETLIEQLPPSGWDNMATKDDLKAGFATLAAADTETRALITETNAAMQAGFATLAAADTETRAAMQAGFAKLDRRLAWYLVAVAALMVGFGLTVWIPLTDALRQQGTPVPPAPPAAAPPATG